MTEDEDYNWYRFGKHKLQVDWDKELNNSNDEDTSDLCHEIGLDRIIHPQRMVEYQ